jgi:hypothetical protein
MRTLPYLRVSLKSHLERKMKSETIARVCLELVLIDLCEKRLEDGRLCKIPAPANQGRKLTDSFYFVDLRNRVKL